MRRMTGDVAEMTVTAVTPVRAYDVCAYAKHARMKARVQSEQRAKRMTRANLRMQRVTKSACKSIRMRIRMRDKDPISGV